MTYMDKIIFAIAGLVGIGADQIWLAFISLIAIILVSIYDLTKDVYKTKPFPLTDSEKKEKEHE